MSDGWDETGLSPEGIAAAKEAMLELRSAESKEVLDFHLEEFRKNDRNFGRDFAMATFIADMTTAAEHDGDFGLPYRIAAALMNECDILKTSLDLMRS